VKYPCSQNKVLLETTSSSIYVLHKTAFVSSVELIKVNSNHCPAKPKIFTIWTFIKFASSYSKGFFLPIPCIKERSEQQNPK
jgi:hypothetical protein